MTGPRGQWKFADTVRVFKETGKLQGYNNILYYNPLYVGVFFIVFTSVLHWPGLACLRSRSSRQRTARERERRERERERVREFGGEGEGEPPVLISDTISNITNTPRSETGSLTLTSGRSVLYVRVVVHASCKSEERSNSKSLD